MEKEYKEKAIDLIKKSMESEIIFLQSYHELLLNRLKDCKTKEELKQIFNIYLDNRN